MKTTISEPRPLTNLRLEMVRRSVSLRSVARTAGVPYTSASRILNGRLIQPANLKKIISAIESFHSRETLATGRYDRDSRDLPEDPDLGFTAQEFHQHMRASRAAESRQTKTIKIDADGKVNAVCVERRSLPGRSRAGVAGAACRAGNAVAISKLCQGVSIKKTHSEPA